jgi:predicted transcriptional regulator
MFQRLPEFSLVATNDWSRRLEGYAFKRRRARPKLFIVLPDIPSKPVKDSSAHFAGAEREPIVVSEHDFGQFVEALSAPAAPSPAHLALVQRRRRAGR